MLKAKTKAPLFSLPNQNGDMINLEDYRGKKVVLYFYPKDDSPGCTIQAKSFRDFNQEIEDLGAVILGVSKDDVDSHEKFGNKHELNFNILSDKEMTTLEDYGVWNKQNMFGKTFMGVSRSTFIIDEDGIIEKAYEKASSKNNPKEVYEYLQDNK